METDPAHSYPSNLMPGSLNLLCSAHDYLGQKSCCTSHNGQLLTYIVNTFLPILSKSKQLSYTDQLKTNLDQAVFCLFAHPSKKARVRHLADHNVSQIALTWHWARQLFKYMRPEKLPEHDDVKLLSISSDLESFLKRLVALLPTEIGIEKRRSTAQQFVQGKKKKLKLKGVAKMPSAVKDVFYLLADYAFKNSKDLDRAIDYYTLDVSVNPKRYDSWAALALAQASKMDKRLNSCKKLVPLKMLDYMKAVETCFKTCLKMNDGNSNLWIEFGNFSYNVHSYISRTLQNNSEGMNIELFERLETKKEELLKTAMENYKQTMRIFEADGIDENDVDERWLIYYMIGKIKEKSNSSLIESLKCYITSMDYLEKNGAILPRKVNYNSPQPLSLETLEIYYRVHASILKYLVKFENKETGIDLNTRQELYNVMQTVQLSKVYSTNAQEDKTSRFSRKRKLATPRPVEEPLDKIARSDESSTMIMRDVIEVVDTLIDDVDFHNDVTKYDFTKLIRLALSGLEDVAFHFFHHFKALYRLAHYYHTSTKSKNLVKVERLLLAGANDRNVLCPGLFFGRKPQQIFNDIWRYPIPEIDRPLSFASHCSKSLMLLLDVLRSLPDLNTLADIVLQLRKPPTEENKFVHESDRLEVGTMANTYLFNTIKSLAASVAVESETAKPSVILDIYKVYQKLQKQWLGKEKDVQVHLRDLFARIKGRTDKEKIAQEEISRFCNAEINKQKASTVQRNLAAIPAVAAAQQTPAVTTAATAVSHAAQSKLSQTDLLKSKESIVGYLNKISNFQETVAMSLPNITVQDVAGMCDLNYSEQPRQVNKLFQTLCKMELAQLKIVNFDSSKLAILSNFATKIGLVGSSVQVYVSRIRAILNGSSLSTHTKISPSTNGNSAGKVNLVRPPQFKQKMTPGQRNLKQLQMYLQQQQGDKSAVSAAKTIISSNLVNAATATTNSQLKAQVSNASPQPTQPIPSVGGQSLQPPQQASAIVKPGSTLTASSSIVSNTLKQLPAGITLTVERKTDSPKEASNNFGGRSFSSGSKVDNVTSKTTTGVPKPTQMVNSNISRSNSQSSIGGTAQQNNLSRSNSQINISRPAQQSNLSRPAQQSNLSRPNSQSNISRSNSQSHISRPNQQMNASRPNTISNPSRPNQQNNVARPSPQNNVSRPSPQNNVSRPSPQNNVSRPSPQNNVSRPSPQNTVTKHGMQSSGTKLAQPNNVSKPSTQNNYGRPNLQSPVGKSSHQTGYTRVAVPTSSSSSQNALAQFRAGLQKTLMMGGSSGAKKESLNQKKPQVLTAKPPQSNPAQKPSGGDPEIICLD